MRFYYISLISVLLLVAIWAAGTWGLVRFGAWLEKRWSKAWMAMLPLFAVSAFTTRRRRPTHMGVQ
jgi:hypothetical protein